ncbi:MAG TPA: RNA polymerase sigma factor [Steroidobacteraceae bacterium]|nr:RNA polymerase sigma factor [Steroidobacteraceae bacterium]
MESGTVTDITRALKDSAGGTTAADGVANIDDDARLMMRYRDGDLAAFQTLYGRHRAALHRYLQRTLRSREAANDVFQEVWSRVIASRINYEPRAQFNTFLYRIAHNCAMDHFRRTAQQRESQMRDIDELVDEIPSRQPRPDEMASHSEVQVQLRRAINALPVEQRDVFVLYEESGLSLEDIGRITGVAMETAKSRLRYAVDKLRAALRLHATGETA